MRPSSLIAALAILALACTAGLSAEPTPIDAAGRKYAVNAAANAMRQRYVNPDQGARASETLKDALAAGRYDTLTDIRAFGEQLTTDLRAVGGDKHLKADALPRPRIGQARPVPPAPLTPRGEAGVVRADRLPGNIGYIELAGFPGLDAFRPVIDRALAPLADTRALIIDARRNTGGSIHGEVYLGSYLLDPGTSVVVARIFWRTPGTRSFQAVEYRNAATPFHYGAKPVYVLTSHRTFSAGEALAYNLQALKRVKVVGEVTGGGGNPGHLVPLRGDLSLFVPAGRNENPITGTSWEGVGVQPDIASPAADALRVALSDLGVATDKTDIDELSETQVFEPDAEPAFRRLLATLVDRDSPQRSASHVREPQSLARRMLRAMGKLESMTFLGTNSGGYDIFDVRFAKGTLTFLIFLDADGEVVIASIEPAPAG